MAIMTLSRLEHTRAARPSHLLQFFLVLLLCDAVRLRTLFLMHFSTGLVVSASLHTFLTAFMLLLESLEKKSLMPVDPNARTSPEQTIGLFSYKKVLKPQDPHNIDKELSSWAIYRVIFQVMKVDILVPIIPKLVYSATNLAQPFLIGAMVKFIERTHSDPSVSPNQGYGLIGAFALNYGCMAVFNGWYRQSLSRFSTKLRSVLVALIYQRTIRIHSKDADLGSATVLMNADIEKVMQGTTLLHEFWILLINTAIALYILYTQLGIPFVAPLMVSVSSIVACSYIGKQIKPRQAAWAAAMEKRVVAISYAVEDIKGIRLLGLSATVREALNQMRALEILARKRQFDIQIILLWISLQMIIAFANAMSSIERIQTYLLKDSAGHELAPEVDDTSFRDSPSATELRELQAPHRKGTTVAHYSNASFGLEPSSPILHGLNFTIRPGTLTMIVGKIGSGKSLLLRSLVGEMWLTSGVATFPSAGVGFCAQTPWLRNTSVRENILGEDEFDDEWYGAVTRACMLGKDFEELPKGDETLIGSKGISLSGGQKGRIALARAVYARKPTLVVDDVLSGLDNTTETHVWRKAVTTVVLATHAGHWAREADEHCVDGRVLYPGSDKHTEVEAEDDKSPAASTAKRSEESADDEAEDDTRRSGDARSLTFWLSSVGWTHVAVNILLVLLANGLTTFQYIWLKHWAESVGRAAIICNMVAFIAITIINLIAIHLWFLLTSRQFGYMFMLRGGASLHGRQLNALMKYECRPFIIAYMTLTSPQSELLFLRSHGYREHQQSILERHHSRGHHVELWVDQYQLRARLPAHLAAMRLMDIESKAPLCTHFLETLSGIMTIRAFGWTSRYTQQNAALLDASQVPFYLLSAIQNWLLFVLELLVAGLIIAMVGLSVGFRHSSSPGYPSLALDGAVDLSWSITYVVISWTQLETCLSAVSRIRRFVRTTPTEEDEGRAAIALGPDPWPKPGTVCFTDFSAAYTPDGDAVLRSVSLDIKAGEKVGICGRTGSEKSSLVATLFGLLYPLSGELSVHGRLAEGVPKEALRQSIVAVPQEPFFLRDRSVRANLTPRDGSDGAEKLKEALEEVGLWARLKEMAGQDDPLELPMAEVEGKLSQGEKQLVCFARAMVTEGSIVVLDEATSSVDAATEALMQKLLRKAFVDRTVIAIAHRMNKILDFDRVVVMKEGRVAEVGPPTKLLETEGGLFPFAFLRMLASASRMHPGELPRF
ncbi:P-loop containing nucleoside triphosphate hydrolase protein [Trichodelitschia bisporula]|uniref:P-loop containing nucleoside triphosphate hydrolase protein n=1 Tax=Trichodelitschia bisporula TaxID=703511 RepID=A0A6G1I103_9PEZI|nr:P-loop containing nucleoside triphosphate hydrolase protein [Trichodelitschia bisporula]